MYGNVEWPLDVTWTAGLSFDSYRRGKLDEFRVNPKIGVRWQTTDRLALRLAYFSTLKPALAVQQTLQPTSVAGFNQLFDDINGSKANTGAAGLDYRFTRDLYGGLEFWHREVDYPVFNWTVPPST